jgi:hypothetical protein
LEERIRLLSLVDIFEPLSEEEEEEVSMGRERDDEGLQDWEKEKQEDREEREQVRQEQRKTKRNLGP